MPRALTSTILLLLAFLLVADAADHDHGKETSGKSGRVCYLSLEQKKGRLYVGSNLKARPFSDYMPWGNPLRIGERIGLNLEGIMAIRNCLTQQNRTSTLELKSRLLNIKIIFGNKNIFSLPLKSPVEKLGTSVELLFSTPWPCEDDNGACEEQNCTSGEGKEARPFIMRGDDKLTLFGFEGPHSGLHLVFSTKSPQGVAEDEDKNPWFVVAVRHWLKTGEQNFTIWVEKKKTKKYQRLETWGEKIPQICNMDVGGPINRGENVNLEEEEGNREPRDENVEVNTSYFKIFSKDDMSYQHNWFLWQECSINFKDRNSTFYKITVPDLNLQLTSKVEMENPEIQYPPGRDPQMYSQGPSTIHAELMSSDLAGKLFGKYLLGLWKMSPGLNLFGEGDVISKDEDITDKCKYSKHEKYKHCSKKSSLKASGSLKGGTFNPKHQSGDFLLNNLDHYAWNDLEEEEEAEVKGEEEEENWGEGAALDKILVQVAHNLTSTEYSIQSNMSVHGKPDGRRLIWIKQLQESRGWPALNGSLIQVFNMSDEDGWETAKLTTQWVTMLVRGEWRLPITQWYQKTFYFLFTKDSGLPPVFIKLDFRDSTKYKVECHFPSLAWKLKVNMLKQESGVFKLTVQDQDEFFPYPHTIVQLLIEFNGLDMKVKWQGTRWDQLADMSHSIFGTLGKVWDSLASSRDMNGQHRLVPVLESVFGSKALYQITQLWEQVHVFAKGILCLAKGFWNLAEGELQQSCNRRSGCSEEDFSRFVLLGALDSLQTLGVVNVNLEDSYIVFYFNKLQEFIRGVQKKFTSTSLKETDMDIIYKVIEIARKKYG